MTRDVRQQLEGLLAKRILILDGAMGTMVQREKLTEEQFRGDRFRKLDIDRLPGRYPE